MTDSDRDVGETYDVRPVVGSWRRKPVTWFVPSIIVLAGGLLFYTLEARRQSVIAPPIQAGSGTPQNFISSPPDLSVPAVPSANDLWMPEPTMNLPGRSGTIAGEQAGTRRTKPAPQAHEQPSMSGYVNPFPAPGMSTVLPGSLAPGGPAVVYDGSGQMGLPKPNDPTGKSEERVTATHFKNPRTTIPKGTVIQCVLETALDSTRPGFARAVVSRNVYGFDGREILVPKGSRLVGEYKADLASGQKRALIQWQRLMRPDGVIINVDSPSADPLGRAGVKGKVDTHFFARFSGAILQSALEVGTQLATRSVEGDRVILALPGSAQNIGGQIGTNVQPTLKVRQGASVSVFVSRDLDFSTVTND